VSCRIAVVLTLAAGRAPGRSLPREVSGQRSGAGDHPAGAGTRERPAPASTARPSVLPIRTLLTPASAPAMVRN
jgi:hypothetical protein